MDGTGTTLEHRKMIKWWEDVERFVQKIPEYTLWYNTKSLLLHKDVMLKERKKLLGWIASFSISFISLFLFNISEHLYRVMLTLHRSVYTVLKGVYREPNTVRKARLDK